MSPPLCLALLAPEQYKRPLGIVTDGRRALTHLALIEIEGVLRRCYVKAFPAPAGLPDSRVRGLLNEIVGYTLAHHAGLPQPPGGLIRLPAAQLATQFGGLAADGPDVVCFVSMEAHNPADQTCGMAKALFSDAAALAAELAGWPHLGPVCAFDTWVANTDRNAGNLVRTGPRQYAIIDHSDILSGGYWLAEELDGGRDFPNKLLDLLCPAHALPLSVKSAIVKAADEFWTVYRKAEPELAFWLGGSSSDDRKRAWHFIWRRAETAGPLLKQRVRLVI